MNMGLCLTPSRHKSEALSIGKMLFSRYREKGAQSCWTCMPYVFDIILKCNYSSNQHLTSAPRAASRIRTRNKQIPHCFKCSYRCVIQLYFATLFQESEPAAMN
ncbi:hypothetical protein XELAEV_18033667mg [Xenopus laevis]|uniref:Uncharacterized protein n=1 Tax=Xenopus laevis TaxID=8355 RepID=A0A974CJP2_XENLA|nr:hypothetical protein XELAEV_18033667mg [Xenopus laevis]